MRWHLTDRRSEPIDGLPDQLLAELRPGRFSRRAMGVHFSYDEVLTLRGIDFGLRTLDLADRQLHYYVEHVGVILALVEALVEKHALRRVCFIGTSKGGFASLLYSRLLAERRPELTVGALAMAPLTRLWPDDPKIKLPTYRNMIARAADDLVLRGALERHGDLTAPASLPNLRWIVGYGVRSSRDHRHALMLSGSSLTLAPLGYSGHNVLIPFLCADRSSKGTRRIVAAGVQRAGLNEDLATDHLSSDEERLLGEIEAMLPRPTVQALVRRPIGL